MIQNSIQAFRMNRANRQTTQTTEKTKRSGLFAREQATETQAQMINAATGMQRVTETPQYNPAEKIEEWIKEVEDIRAERTSKLEEQEELIRPKIRYENEFRGTVEPPEKIKEDSEFTSAVSALADKYSISESEVYAVIQGESRFNPKATNKSGATGLFQFMPGTAEELGTSTEAILNMSPTEQVALYDKYLSRWNYDGKNRLGIMQAAPAYADRGPDEVIYAKDTAAWKQNPGWRELGDGPITVKSINNYYAKRAVK